jgi:glycosyltransferase involved in cell wall biosynthesis
MAGTPLVSVGVPTRNRAATLARALDGLLRQDYGALEIIVSDNASTDDTSGLCREYCERDQRIQYSRNDNDLGARANFSKVLEASRGEYFMWAADDDWLEPGFVRALVGELEADAGLALAAAEARYVLPDGQMLPFFPEGEGFYAHASTSASLVDRLIAVVNHNYGNLFYGIYRRSALTDGSRNALSCVTASTLNEIPLYLQVVAHGDIRVIPQQLLYKTTTLPTFRQAAEEYGWVLEEKAGHGLVLRRDRPFKRGAHDGQPTILVPAWSAGSGFHDSVARHKPYHDDALRDMIAALAVVALTFEERVFMAEYCRLRSRDHLFDLAMRESAAADARPFWARVGGRGWRSTRP